MPPMRATGCCSAQPFLTASRATSGGSAACRLPSGMGCMCANSRPTMNASGGPAATPSRSHRARAPGTETALGRSSTPGRAKTFRASSSTTPRCGFCSSCACGLVGVVLGRAPPLSGKSLSFIFLPAPIFPAFVRVGGDGSVDHRFRTPLPGSYTPARARPSLPWPLPHGVWRRRVAGRTGGDRTHHTKHQQIRALPRRAGGAVGVCGGLFTRQVGGVPRRAVVSGRGLKVFERLDEDDVLQRGPVPRVRPVLRGVDRVGGEAAAGLELPRDALHAQEFEARLLRAHAQGGPDRLHVCSADLGARAPTFGRAGYQGPDPLPKPPPRVVGHARSLRIARTPTTTYPKTGSISMSSSRRM